MDAPNLTSGRVQLKKTLKDKFQFMTRGQLMAHYTNDVAAVEAVVTEKLRKGLWRLCILQLDGGE